jgi:hypothetical protein
MGTNYYVVPNRPSVREPIHIGKSSSGWMFLFHDVSEQWNDPPVEWHTYEQVMGWLKRYVAEKGEFVIMDEYDEVVPFKEFKDMVDEKQERDRNNPDNFDYCKNVNGYRFTEGEFC